MANPTFEFQMFGLLDDRITIYLSAHSDAIYYSRFAPHRPLQSSAENRRQRSWDEPISRRANYANDAAYPYRSIITMMPFVRRCEDGKLLLLLLSKVTFDELWRYVPLRRYVTSEFVGGSGGEDKLAWERKTLATSFR